MVYRIRYRDVGGEAERIATVEANSPTEAMVKFRCIFNPREHTNAMPETVTSIVEDAVT
jgi:hypothetical protein